MCLICIDLQKGKLTTSEAKRNLMEIRDTINADHQFEVLELIYEQEEEEED